MPTAFTGGSLSFKGDKKKKKKVKKKEESSSAAKHKIKNDSVPAAAAFLEQDMTAAERRAMERKKERLRIDNENLARKSHRERIEEFNERLGSASEHNDIPRVRALPSCYLGCYLYSKFTTLSLTLFIHFSYRSVLQEMDKVCFQNIPLVVEAVPSGDALHQLFIVVYIF